MHTVENCYSLVVYDLAITNWHGYTYIGEHVAHFTFVLSETYVVVVRFVCCIFDRVCHHFRFV